MRIDREIDGLSKLQQQELRTVGHQEPARERAQGMQRRDQVTLSSRAQEIQQLYQALATVPPERAERVAALRQAIESGSYEVPVDELVDRLAAVVYPQR